MSDYTAHGIVQDAGHHDRHILPALDDRTIRYHGVTGEQARLDALGNARALLHLINFDEPFGLSVVEAMACGTPVIANRRGSMAEIIEHGVTGFLVDDMHQASNAIERAGDIDRATVRQAVVDRFSIDRMADEYLSLYRRILAA